MLKYKKSKTQKMRGSSSHGWGAKKKNRGSGNRGGFGLSGTGARGDAKKSAVLSNALSLRKVISAQKGIKLSNVKLGTGYFGKRGFKSVNKKKNKTLSLSYIEENFDVLLENEIIKKEGSNFILDVTQLGFNKVLGKGNFSKKITLICDQISSSAKLRVEEVGGKVILSNSKETSEE